MFSHVGVVVDGYIVQLLLALGAPPTHPPRGCLLGWLQPAHPSILVAHYFTHSPYSSTLVVGHTLPHYPHTPHLACPTQLVITHPTHGPTCLPHTHPTPSHYTALAILIISRATHTSRCTRLIRYLPPATPTCTLPPAGSLSTNLHFFVRSHLRAVLVRLRAALRTALKRDV